MSRIGKKPIALPVGVDVHVADRTVKIKGPKGGLEQSLPAGVDVAHEANQLVVTRSGEDKQTRALHGLVRALLQNHVVGVTQGYEIPLEIVGVSYQASVQGNSLSLKLGYANEIELAIPAGVTVDAPNPTALIVRGVDKQKVGQFAAEIRGARPPEPYKGKGVRYRGEHIQRKQGKSFVGSE